MKVATASRILGMLGLVRESTGHVSARIPGTDEMWVRCRGGDENGLVFTGLHNVRRTDFDGEGPGMGQEADAKARLMRLIRLTKPMVIDADALNILAAQKKFPKPFGADAILTAKNGVAGVYDGDPRTDPTAQFLPRLTHLEAIERGLKVMDTTALSLCMDNRLTIHVFELAEGNIARVVAGEQVGTVIETP